MRGIDGIDVRRQQLAGSHVSTVTSVGRDARVLRHRVEDGLLVFEQRLRRVELGDSTGVEHEYPARREGVNAEQ